MIARLVKRPSEDVIASARRHKMVGWASSVANEHDDPDTPMFAIEDDAGIIVGQAGLRIWPVGSSRATATIAIFDPRCRGKGFGTEAMRRILSRAFSVLGLQRVTIRVDAGNAAAMQCYRKAGFSMAKEGKDGAVHMMALRGKWLEENAP